MAGFFSKKQYAAIADKELAIKLLNDYYNVFMLYKRKNINFASTSFTYVLTPVTRGNVKEELHLEMRLPTLCFVVKK